MSTGIDLSFIQETYGRMSDQELIRIATQDAFGLTPEALEVVKAEIRKRGLDESIAKGAEAQNKDYTIEELNAYCDIVSRLSCPSCGGTTQRLNATLSGEVMSFVVITRYKKKVTIGCPDCLDKANEAALVKTALLGWWGIPWGIIRSIQYIRLNMKSKKTNHLPEHNDYLRSFTYGNIGQLETYKNNQHQLQQIIQRYKS